MKLPTMAAVMTFISKLENEAAGFYGRAAIDQPEASPLIPAWERENRKFEKQVQQTYYGVITDTLESNYSFEGLEADDFKLDVELPDGAATTLIRAKARAIESTTRDFYVKAAELSEGLMADVPRLFRKIAKKREDRLEHLAGL